MLAQGCGGDFPIPRDVKPEILYPSSLGPANLSAKLIQFMLNYFLVFTTSTHAHMQYSVDLSSGELTTPENWVMHKAPGCIVCWEHEWPK